MGEAAPRRAVFLDRDGTINVEKDYLIDPEQLEFIPGVPEALKRLQGAGFLLVVVTNQAGVARGYFTAAQVEALHRHMCGLLSKAGVSIDRIEICPHHPTAGEGEYTLACNCRKGKPGMLLKAAEELQIDLSHSFMIGDKLADVEAGLAAGCRTYLVLTGYGIEQQRLLKDPQVKIRANLPTVVDEIIRQV